MCRVSPTARSGGKKSGAFEEGYRLLDHILGEGAFGSVHEAECLRTGRSVAVKIYDKAAMSAQVWRALQEELHNLESVSHPGVVNLEGWYEDEARVLAVFERLSGQDLLERLDAEEFGCPEHEVAGVARQLLQALEYLHSNNIIHRDVKLENAVFANENGKEVKLVDFGFSKKTEDGVKLRERCGSLQYVAPEVLSGAEYDARCDIYSVGGVVYALLTTEPLFDGEDHTEVLRKNTMGDVDWSPCFFELSSDAQAFLRSLLAETPDQRPTATEALKHPWLLRCGRRDSDMASLAASADVAPELPDLQEDQFGEPLSFRFVRQISLASTQTAEDPLGIEATGPSFTFVRQISLAGSGSFSRQLSPAAVAGGFSRQLSPEAKSQDTIFEASPAQSFTFVRQISLASVDPGLGRQLSEAAAHIGGMGLGGLFVRKLPLASQRVEPGCVCRGSEEVSTWAAPKEPKKLDRKMSPLSADSTACPTTRHASEADLTLGHGDDLPEPAYDTLYYDTGVQVEADGLLEVLSPTSAQVARASPKGVAPWWSWGCLST